MSTIVMLSKNGVTLSPALSLRINSAQGRAPRRGLLVCSDASRPLERQILRFAQNDRWSDGGGLAGGVAPVGFAPEVE